MRNFVGPVVLEKKIVKLSYCLFAISLLSPLEKRSGPSFVEIRGSFNQECFVPSWVEIGPMVLEEEIFKFRPCVFLIS